MAAKAEFYDTYVGAVRALTAERKKNFLDTIKRGKVGVLMQTECYAVKSDTISDIVGKSSPQNSSFFATLYKGWPLDSQANPLRVKAVFKTIHGTISTSGGAIVPCSVIDAQGLEVQELAEYPEAQRTPTNQTPKSVGKSDDDDDDDDDDDEIGDDEEEDESDQEEDKKITPQEFDDFMSKVKTQLFAEDENRVNIVEHEKLLNAYTRLQAKYNKLMKEADEVKATAETLRVELEGWGRFERALDESRPKKG
ncbi:g1178 [Coccomyxa elongata]